MKTNKEPRKNMWVRIGWIMSGLAITFLLFDSLTKIMMVDAVMKASARIGYPANLIPATGAILLVCLILYAFPRTQRVGAMLLTGYLGGAVEVNLHAGSPLVSNTLFPVYFAVIVWGGLFLRDERVKAFFTLKKRMPEGMRVDSSTTLRIARPQNIPQERAA